MKGKVAIVTGAGSGVGRAITILFAQNGANVVAVDVIPDRVTKVVEETKAMGTVTGKVMDLSLKSEPGRMVDEVLASHGRLDILCNNAGIMDAVRPVAETPDDVWEKVMDINLNAPFRASRKAIPAMLKQGSGVIVNTASVAGMFGGIAGAAYTVSKHGLIGLTRNIAAMYGSKGIRCNAMVLGAVQTAIGMGGEPNPTGAAAFNKILGTIPARIADPVEIARLALFLASDDGSYMNGSCVVIDNGWTVF